MGDWNPSRRQPLLQRYLAPDDFAGSASRRHHQTGLTIPSRRNLAKFVGPCAPRPHTSSPVQFFQFYCESLRVLLFLLRRVRILRGLLHMRRAVRFQFRVGQIEMRVRGVIFSRGQLHVQPVRTNIRRILKSHAPRIKSLVGNGQRKFPRFRRCFANRERIFPAALLRFESHELHDHAIAVVVAHFPAPTGSAAAITAAAFFTRLARLRFGGVPSACSTTMMLVTNFFIPCRSKSIEVRSLSDSVMTPKPYWKCLMYCPSGSAFNEAPKTDATCAKKKGEPADAGSPLFD